MDFSPETLRARFHELTEARGAIDANLDPLRAELDGLAAGETKLTAKAAREREAEVRARIVDLQRQLAPIEQERAACARALGGKTGSAEA